jgi:hypothetical protein
VEQVLGADGLHAESPTAEIVAGIHKRDERLRMPAQLRK